MAHGQDFGIVNLYLNDKVIYEKVDLFSTIADRQGLIIEEPQKLSGGRDILKIDIVGKNQQSLSSYYQCGTDGITLKPAFELEISG